uniref:2-amino-4-hydroxy-6-hydroxymethyldihydropteridine pyrophosphokinase n=1 Tax=OCS116 cluster bacterium TaxID=2030921 RepID=A0A2A4YRH1_9PROT
MIILSLGSNLPSKWGKRMETLSWAIEQLGAYRIDIIRQSAAYGSPPMTLNSKNSLNAHMATQQTIDDDDLPDLYYVNINLMVKTSKGPAQLLYCLKQIEQAAGRAPGKRWASRPLDIDIIDYKGVICGAGIEYNQRKHAGFLPLTLPHPGLCKRAFVLKPLWQIAPFWHHPQNGKTASQLINTLK